MIILFWILDIFFWIIIAHVVMSWLLVFGVLNIKNDIVRKIYDFLNRVMEPPMQFLRKFIPPIGGIDITPMILIFGIYLAQRGLYQMAYGF